MGRCYKEKDKIALSSCQEVAKALGFEPLGMTIATSSSQPLLLTNAHDPASIKEKHIPKVDRI